MLLRISFSALGIAAVFIGGMIFVVGPNSTAHVFADAMRIVIPGVPPVAGLGGADIDSEMRFYAAIWMAYGGAALWVARDIAARLKLMRLMLVVFWLGGLGRVISYVTVGAPHPLFVVLMWIEIALPPLLIALSHRRAATSD